MNKKRYSLLPQIIIIIAVVLMGVCFVASMMTIDEFAKDDCFDSIEETTTQISNMFVHTMEQNQTQLTLFADILAANETNPDELLQKYMENFCKTQNFSAVCIHRADGSTISYGFHPHDEVSALSFENEILKLPYISDVIDNGAMRKDKYIYQAVPIVRNGQKLAILYGYISLDTLPLFISSTAYDGKCEFYIVDGNTGDYLMDEYHRNVKGDRRTEVPLGNIFDDTMMAHETKSGYDMNEMRHKVKGGESGYCIFRSQRTGEWYYMYFMPLGINNWSMQLTIDEPTAFATYVGVQNTVFVLMLGVVGLALIVIVFLMLQNAGARKVDKENLRRSDYINNVQGALISAHNNPDFVHQALKIVAKEFKAETVLLLPFEDKRISNAYYWPSRDKASAMVLIGLDICEVFPNIYDTLVSGESVFVGDEFIEERLFKETKDLLIALDVSNMLLVPIRDNSGVLKACIAAVNIPAENNRPEMLECLTRDFFLAITNLESYTVIKNMGSIDYLTGVKNRNSYETELKDIATWNAESLWCIYVDVNGLHEMNNTQGHSAGDQMLISVAKVMKNVLGEKYVYRLGGDEFIAFVKDSSHEVFMSYKHRIIDALAEKGYFVSVGFEGTEKNENRVFDVEKIVRAAETIMYKEKHEYYVENQLPTERIRIEIDDQ